MSTALSKCRQPCQNVDFYVTTKKKISTVDIMTVDILTVDILMASRKSGGASRWRVCYERGRPRLVFLWLPLLSCLKI